MAEDDTNQAPTQGTGTTAAETSPAPVKKKAVRKKAPQVKAEKKKASVKKPAAPKKKAARKGRSPVAARTPAEPAPAAQSSALQAEHITVAGPVAETSGPPATDPVSGADPVSGIGGETASGPASAAATEQSSPEITAADAGAASTPPESGPAESESAEPLPTEAPMQKNENVQKRLEEMGLMPSDSTENPTPPPPRKTGAGLGLWQKSFIWAIVVVAGLLYLRNVANNGEEPAELTANRIGETDKTVQIAGGGIPDRDKGVTPAEPGPAGSIADPTAEAGEPLLITVTETAGAETAQAQGGEPAPVLVSATDPAAQGGQAVPATAAQDGGGPGRAVTDSASTGQADAASPVAMAGQTAQPPATNEAPTAEAEINPAPTGTEPPVVANGAVATDNQMQSSAAESGTPATTPDATATSGTAAPAGIANRIAGSQSSGMAPAFGMMPMWNRPNRGMMPGGYPAARLPETTQPDASRNQATAPASPIQPPAGMPATGPRYQSPYPPRGYGYSGPGYPWGFNPQPMPYYWPYPPRPPVYGPALGYPYHYPQIPR